MPGTNERVTDPLSVIKAKAKIVTQELTEKLFKKVRQGAVRKHIRKVDQAPLQHPNIIYCKGRTAKNEIRSDLNTNRLQVIVGPLIGRGKPYYGSVRQFWVAPFLLLLGNNIGELKAAKKEAKDHF